MKKDKKMPKNEAKTKVSKRIPSPQKGIFPTGDKVLIRPASAEELQKKLASGIIIPETVKEEKTDRGVVVAVGPGRYTDQGVLMPVRVKAGDTVLFQWGDKVEVHGEEYYLVSESNILAVIK